MDKAFLIIGVGGFLGTTLNEKIDTHLKFIVSKHTKGAMWEIPYEDLHRFKCIVYLRPDADQRMIDMKIKDKVPILSIGSGGLIDFKKGKIPENDYIKGKRKIVEMSTCTIHPGFFIPSKEDPYTGTGLHRETLFSLFYAREYRAKDFNMEKSYYMTPVDQLCTIIKKFIESPHKYVGEYAFGSPMAISRLELYENKTPRNPREYEEEMLKTKEVFGEYVSDEIISTFHDRAEGWVEKRVKEHTSLTLC